MTSTIYRVTIPVYVRAKSSRRAAAAAYDYLMSLSSGDDIEMAAVKADDSDVSDGDYFTVVGGEVEELAPTKSPSNKP